MNPSPPRRLARLRQTKPLQAMESLATIASTGQYQPPHGDQPVPAVTTFPAGDDPLLRSWEYSLATSAARKQNSHEREELAHTATYNMFGRVDGKRAIGDDQVSDKNYQAVKQAIKTGFSFDYDPLDKITSEDGSSTSGRYVIKSLTTGKQIKTPEDFIADLEPIVLNALGLTKRVIRFQSGVRCIGITGWISRTFCVLRLKPFGP